MKCIVCINCGNSRPILHSTTTTNPNKYCSRECQSEYKLKEVTIPRFLKGEIKERPTLKRVLKYLYGNICVDCGNKGEHNGKPLMLQLDHIDGDASNDKPDNVRLLCPNCHSQTDTFTAKNKGNGRGSRSINR
jgi:5-methylcytosine-specific restriction endonuclease McrA